MSEKKEYTAWEPKTIDCIGQNRSIFKSVAAKMKISAEALAGAMAKENNSYQLNTAMEVFKDTRALKEILGGTVDHAQWSDRYDVAKKLNWIDNASELKKIHNPVLIDLGPFNLQGATAIQALNEYVQANPNSDPYNLKQYQRDYAKFLSTIAGPGAAPREYTVNAEESVRVSAIVWGMQIKKAQKWFESKKKGDEGFVKYWDGLPQETKDALYGQWCVFGRDKMEERYRKNIRNSQHLGVYEAKLGEGDPGGLYIYGNSRIFGKALGNGRYGADTVEPKWEKHIYGRAAITYNNDGTVTINKGGTLREICEQQRKKGNPITPDDLRSVNENIQDIPDTRIPAGTTLVIPKRQGDKLVVDSAERTVTVNNKVEFTDKNDEVALNKESGGPAEKQELSADNLDAGRYQENLNGRGNLLGGDYFIDRDSPRSIKNEGFAPEITIDEPSSDTSDSSLRHALAALGVKPREVQFTPAEADDENQPPASFDIRDNDTSEKVGSYAVTPTGCEMTAGDRKVVMDRISGNDIHLQTYAKNDEGDFELLGTSRISDNDGVTVRRPFAA